MSVKVRAHPRGGWDVDIMVPLATGQRHRDRRKLSGNVSKTTAREWGERRERELLRNGPVKPQKEVPTLEEFSTRFVEGYARANRQKPSGIAAKESIIKTHLVPVLGAHKLDAITNADVQRLKQHLASKASKTVNNVLTVMNVMLKQAVEWCVIEKLPCSIRLLPVVRSEAAFYEFDEYERLLDAARGIGWRTHVIVLLGGDAGLRVGEIVALSWADVDFGRGHICVRHSDWRGELTTPKNGRVRFVSMTERLAAILRQHRHLRSTRVLCKDDGRPLTRQGAWSHVRYAARRAKVRTGVHILRHTFCSHLAMHGAAGRAIQDLVGHQDLTMTQRYMHLSPDAADRTIRLLERGRPVLPDGDIVETGTDGKNKANG